MFYWSPLAQPPSSQRSSESAWPHRRNPVRRPGFQYVLQSGGSQGSGGSGSVSPLRIRVMGWDRHVSKIAARSRNHPDPVRRTGRQCSRPVRQRASLRRYATEKQCRYAFPSPRQELYNVCVRESRTRILTLARRAVISRSCLKRFRSRLDQERSAPRIDQTAARQAVATQTCLDLARSIATCTCSVKVQLWQRGATARRTRPADQARAAGSLQRRVDAADELVEVRSASYRQRCEHIEYR